MMKKRCWTGNSWTGWGSGRNGWIGSPPNCPVGNCSGSALPERCARAQDSFSAMRSPPCEITAMLDLVTRAGIWNCLMEEAKKRGLGLLVVSHDEKLLGKVCTRVVEL